MKPITHASRVLGSKALAGKIHPPLPLNPRESEQLLSMLTTSFRCQLEKEYPNSEMNDDIDTVHPFPRASSPSTVPGNGRRLTAQTYANRHYNSVLQNPLFLAGPHVYGTPISKTRERFASVTKSSMGDARQLCQDPMGWFDGHVARGTATIGHAELCLRTLKASMSARTGRELRQAMKDSDAGSKVVNWIWSSGIENTKEFFSAGALLYPLSQFLVEEGRWGPLLRWLRTPSILSLRADDASLEPILLWRSNLLQAVVEGQLKHESGQCTAAIQFFLRAVSEKECLPDHPKEFTQWVDHSVFSVAGRWLAHELFKPASYTRLLTTPPLFDQFVSTIPIWTKRLGYYKARLALHHPQEPDPMPALQQIRDYSKHPPRLRKLAFPAQRRGYVVFCFGVVRLLLRREEHDNAAMVLRFINDHFPEEVGLQNDILKDQPAGYYFNTRTKRFFPVPTSGEWFRDEWSEEKKKNAEKTNLSLLDKLALG